MTDDTQDRMKRTDESLARQLNQSMKMNQKFGKQLALEEQIIRLSKSCKLDTWMNLVREVNLPADLHPVLASGRPELIKLMPPRELTADEAKMLYDIIGALIETNFALREHAAQLADFVGEWTQAFKHLRSVGDRINRFALFDHKAAMEDEDGG